MLEPMILLVCACILTSGVLAVALSSPLAAIVTAGLAGLFAALSFLLLAAPDVAMAEAAIGLGLSTFIIALRLAQNRIRGEK